MTCGVRSRKFLMAIPTAAVLLAGCGGDTGQASPRGTHYYLFIDQSFSLAPAQGDAWSKLAERSLRHLSPGDAITMFGLHDHTRDASALFDEATTFVPRSQGASKQNAGAQRLKTVKADALAAVTAALQSRTSQWTDVLGAFDRIRPDPDGRRLEAILMTDALHSTRDLDLERVRLRSETLPAVLEAAGTGHHWSKTTLAGVDVRFLLNGAQIGDKPAIVSRDVLHQFYEAMVKGLGGRLTSFDTSLDDARGGRR